MTLDGLKTIGRHSLLALALATALTPVVGASVMAADMPQARQDPVFTQAPTAAAYLWSGAYLGLHAGYGWGDVKESIGPRAGKSDANGFLGGIQGGINFQSGNIVYGVEGDFSYAPGGESKNLIGVGSAFDQKWLATARARLGVAVDRSLFYVTGGAAFTQADVKLGGFSRSTNMTGWTAGGGWEYAVNDRFTVRAEYLYADFGKDTLYVGGSPVNVDYAQSIARIGANWKFGGF